MRKSLILLLLILFSIYGLKAQQSEIISPWNIKAAYTNTPEYNASFFNANNLIIETNYRIFKPIDIGLYAGYGQNKTNTYTCSQYNFGANINLQLLPLITQNTNFRLNLYLSAKVGGVHNYFSDGYKTDDMTQLTYGLYFGVEYFITKHIGFFVESGYAKINSNRANFRVGIAYKF